MGKNKGVESCCRKVPGKVEIVRASKAANKLTMGNHLAMERHPLITSFGMHAKDPPGVNPKGDPHPDAWEVQPERTSRQIITHDPLEGFPEGRKEREPPVSKEVIDAWRVPSIRQNFCVEDFIKFRKCQLREHPILELSQGTSSSAPLRTERENS